MGNLLTIGEFSRATRLSVKALRFYDEKGVLRPVWVDEATGYRHYWGSSWRPCASDA